MLRKYVNWTILKGQMEEGSSGGTVQDSSVDFLAMGVRVGDILVLEETGEEARVTSVTSHSLSIDPPLAEAGASYRLLRGWPEVAGSSTSVEEKALVDENADFVAAGIRPGFTVYSEGEVAWVTQVETTRLGLSRHIITQAGQSYRVYPGDVLSAEGLREIDLCLRRSPRTLAADDAEKPGPGDLLTFRFLSHSEYPVGRLIVLVEAKGNGELEVRIDGSTVATLQVATDDYSVYRAEVDLSLDPTSSHTFLLTTSDPVTVRTFEALGRWKD